MNWLQQVYVHKFIPERYCKALGKTQPLTRSHKTNKLWSADASVNLSQRWAGEWRTDFQQQQTTTKLNFRRLRSRLGGWRKRGPQTTSFSPKAASNAKSAAPGTQTSKGQGWSNLTNKHCID